MRNDPPTNDAAAITAWLTQQVQEAIDDPRLSGPHTQIAAERKLERVALAQQAKSDGH